MRQKRKARAQAEAERQAHEVAPEAEAPEEEVHDNVLTPSATGHLESIVESLLFAADKPLTPKDLQKLTKEQEIGPIQTVLDELVAYYEGRGIVLHTVAGGYQFRTAPANSGWVQQLVAGRPVRLTRAQLECLAIIAYRQPITRPEIEDIRGVDSGSSLRVLLERNLIRIVGKKEEPGRPMLYGTTKDFLEFFNLKDLRELPTLREFHELTEDSMREVEKLGLDADELQAQMQQEPTEAEADDAGNDDEVVAEVEHDEAEAVQDEQAELPEGEEVVAEAEGEGEGEAEEAAAEEAAAEEGDAEDDLAEDDERAS